jgi:fibronectin type 3 domain-containing protein
VTDLQATRKADRVSLSWSVPTQTTDGQTVRHMAPIQVCRALDSVMKECGTPVGAVAAPSVLQSSSTQRKRGRQKSANPSAKIPASYVDTIPPELQKENPTGQITYAVAALNEDGRSAGLSNQVQVPAAPTLPPPEGLQAQVNADGIVLSWAESSEGQELPHLRHSYRVYRREQGSANSIAIGEIPLDASTRVQLVDHSFEWEKTYDYRVTVVTLISPPGKPGAEVEGNDSTEMKVFAHDLFPPAVPSGLEAVASGVGQPPFVDLIWAPNTDADLAGYNIYRHEEGAPPVKINSDLVKTPAFRDTTVLGGKKYFYSVTAVDLRGNESAHSEEASETVLGAN